MLTKVTRIDVQRSSPAARGLAGMGAAARLALLPMSAAAPLERHRDALAAGGRAVPHFDPLDGGADAKCLILLETPGAGMTGDDFVSRDNPTGTGRNLTRFALEAGLLRADTVIWNTVPWVVHAPGAANRPLRAGETREGLATLPDLLALLPRLRVAVLLGRPAAAAEPVIAEIVPNVAVLKASHPSPTIVCTDPAVAAGISGTLARAAGIVAGQSAPATSLSSD